MATQVGTALHLQWCTSSATINFNTDYRDFKTSETKELLEETAGADADKKYIVSYGDGNASFSGLYQSGGTTPFASCRPGQLGTLKVGWDGSAAGSVLETIPAIVSTLDLSDAYNDLVKIDISWQQNGSKSYGTL
jgi:hypothetical protein